METFFCCQQNQFPNHLVVIISRRVYSNSNSNHSKQKTISISPTKTTLNLNFFQFEKVTHDEHKTVPKLLPKKIVTFVKFILDVLLMDRKWNNAICYFGQWFENFKNDLRNFMFSFQFWNLQKKSVKLVFYCWTCFLYFDKIKLLRM